ncbi:hypothetical protein AAFF_G00441220 [Aldrovandia affinis]|uniref:Solute carrier family 19 member 3a n=1 Tax=Aldrovandia affinis TaxID=143900 RepID=A0AAD7WHS7_9TELE|nr:hypothetical protein AAFF_G00441220 [Aldrovandia affinis]
MDSLRRLQAQWVYPTGLLCVYGFFTTVKPLEPFLIPYLTGPDKNLTTEQVTNEIFPVWTYSYLVILLPVFLLTDYLRYKPVIVFQCASLFVTTALLLWSEGVAAMQAMQFFYGLVTASEVAYFSYIYSMVDLQHYRRATSLCRSIQLLGYTVGSVLGQVLVSFSLMSYNNILVLTLVLTSIALAISFFLPMPQRSMFYHHRDSRAATHTLPTANMQPNALEEAGKETGDHISPGGGGGGGGGRVWWALATCGYNQTINYVQVLWEHVQPSQNFTVYNGGVEALSNLLGAASAYAIGFTQVNWASWGELALGSCSALGAAALFLMTFVGSIWVCYAGYIIFKSLYMLLITIAM